jgi:diguanylate cyclase (GGDEF)-like protein
MPFYNSERTQNAEIHLNNMRNNITGIAQPDGRNLVRQKEVDETGVRLTQLLQRTLDIEVIIQFFCQEIATLVPCDSVMFINIEQDLGYSFGSRGSNVSQYTLNIEGQYLGELICTRNKPFGEQDLLIVEKLTATLVYPLRNSIMYRSAISLALEDSLTGIGNRKALQQAIDREQHLIERHDTPFSMLMIDIDFFKRINDQFGHSGGDLALKTVSKTIMDIIRQSDQLFRYGGEEFVVLLNNSDVNTATFMAERIRQAIEQNETLCQTKSIKVTVSIGVAHFNKKECLDQLFERADKALYEAKENGRNQVIIAA